MVPPTLMRIFCTHDEHKMVFTNKIYRRLSSSGAAPVLGDGHKERGARFRWVMTAAAEARFRTHLHERRHVSLCTFLYS